MVEIGEALRILAEQALPLGTAESPLDALVGRALAEPALADRDFPPTDRSAMDGYAVRAEDLAHPGDELEIAGEVRAGQPAAVRVEAGQAVRIMTGAVVPEGADTVVMVERTRETAAGRVAIDEVPQAGRNIRRQGQDLRRGQAVLEPGTPIHAPEIAALTSIGMTRVKVFRAPEVHVLSTGDEVVEPDREPLAHQVRNSNAHTLLAQLSEMSISGRYEGIAADEGDGLARLLERGLSGDVLLITGGVSVGKYDLVARTLENAGMRLLFHKVAMKPGKPILAGKAGDCLVVGLPGNPVSTYVGFAVFVAPALRRMMGYRRWDNVEVPATLSESFEVRPGRVTYHLARVGTGTAGLQARRVRTTGSGDVLSMSRANGLIVTPATGGTFETGASLPILVWNDFLVR